MPIFQKEKTEEEVGQLDQVRSQREYIERESIPISEHNSSLGCSFLLRAPPARKCWGGSAVREGIYSDIQEQLQSVDRFPYFLPFHLDLFSHCFSRAGKRNERGK